VPGVRARGCEIKSIVRTDDAGVTKTLLPRELVRLARQEGCRVKFPPRVRRTRKTVSSILLAIVASLLPNYFGDFCTLLFRTASACPERSRRVPLMMPMIAAASRGSRWTTPPAVRASDSAARARSRQTVGR
jgi:hypothetical protein